MAASKCFLIFKFWCLFLFIVFYLTAAATSLATATKQMLDMHLPARMIPELWKWHAALGYAFVLSILLIYAHNIIVARLKKTREKDIEMGLRHKNWQFGCAYLLTFLPLVTAVGLLSTSVLLYLEFINKEMPQRMFYSAVSGMAVAVPAVLHFSCALFCITGSCWLTRRELVSNERELEQTKGVLIHPQPQR
ncbi:uncharacterized protein LOC129594925 isoform X2 [Paramacrobiotus metropolitanus]|uniref:uncharacterized protein LOC129594925 isoform X2 n=1 Tax=Paramacrobiotus metropolitanus TaxID=2943436 RepID=UPI0024461890|nr:uncharacterized protein LOC129594925 isoform X2 [Paramacrobiotus metropolitanus]